MKCPVCKDKDLVIADRQGVEIDYCPECRGIWLDRGELDKIFERTGETYSHGKSGQKNRMMTMIVNTTTKASKDIRNTKRRKVFGGDI